MRGEHFKGFSKANFTMGSSPHARGALLALIGIDDQPGIIPACAGSTVGVIRRDVTCGDHPRMRGEHCFQVPLRRALLGSSPHARGAHNNSIIVEQILGIIPACAGSTVVLYEEDGWSRDHPRMRGEHS